MPPHVIIVAAPRSGGGLLQSTWLLDRRWRPSALSNEDVIDATPGFSVAERGYQSHRLDADDLTSDLHARLTAADESDRPTADWNPRLALRIPLLARALPQAQFVLVLREPEPTIASVVEAWASRRFASVEGLPGWWGDPWSFPLIEGWAELIGAPAAEVAAAQSMSIATAIIDDLSALPADRWAATTYEALVDHPQAEIESLAAKLQADWRADLPSDLPLSPATLSPPSTGKWRRHASEIGPALASRAEALERIRAFRAAHTAGSPTAGDTPRARPPMAATRPSAGTVFSSEHTASLAELLTKTQSSVLLTTYKSGHVILARSDGSRVDTAVTSANRPMGAAVSKGRLSIGTSDAIRTFSNHSGLAQQLNAVRGDEASGPANDAIYVPRTTTVTGDIAIHEMAYADDDVLWFVNTRFSCLCTQDLLHSFVPVWRPSWITALAAEDRCHLNGLAMVDGRPRYVTALARTDVAHGWREHKGTSGVIVDVTDDAVVAAGLAMPHSPRWHDGRLWVLESGKGSLATVDLASGAVTTVAVLPGFTRGLAFIGRYALVGLSQVRESVFSGLPVTGTAAERNCGMWVVDTVTGAIPGLLRFDGVVQEMFDVQVLPSARWPMIVEAGDLATSAFILPPEALAQVVPEAPTRP